MTVKQTVTVEMFLQAFRSLTTAQRQLILRHLLHEPRRRRAAAGEQLAPEALARFKAKVLKGQAEDRAYGSIDALPPTCRRVR